MIVLGCILRLQYVDGRLMFLIENYVGADSIERLGSVTREQVEFLAEYLFSELTFLVDVTAGPQYI